MKVTTDDVGISAAWNRKPSYPLRRVSIATRCALLVLAAWNLVVLASGLAGGHLYLLSLAGAVLAAAAFPALRWTSSRLRAVTAERNRPRPDYSLIARMEREVYGEAFAHDGAPRQFPIESQERVAAAREALRKADLGLYGYRHQGVTGQCAVCDEMRRR